MTVTKLTEVTQATHITGGGPAQYGISYYMCDYMEEHADSPWKNPKDFKTAKASVTRFACTPMVNAAKAMNLKKDPQKGQYHDVTPLKTNSLYRAEIIMAEEKGKMPTEFNHETMMLTGDGEMILFDPNYGFYHIDNITNGDYHTAFESQLNVLYGTGHISTKIGYKRKRKAFS